MHVVIIHIALTTEARISKKIGGVAPHVTSPLPRAPPDVFRILCKPAEHFVVPPQASPREVSHADYEKRRRGTRLLFGLSTKWISSGNMTSRLPTPRLQPQAQPRGGER